jgi:sodium pump decarboxylase gamma subunit
MFLSSIILLITGLGMTFTFLFVLILLTNISSKLSEKYAFLMPEPESRKAARPESAPVAESSDGDSVAAAIALALFKHTGK